MAISPLDNNHHGAKWMHSISPFEEMLRLNLLGPSGDVIFCFWVIVQNVAIFGYSRSELSDDEFRDLISESATCRVDGDQ